MRTFEIYYNYSPITNTRILEDIISKNNPKNGLIIRNHNKDHVLQLTCESLVGLGLLIQSVAHPDAVYGENTWGDFCRSVRRSIENWIG